MSHTWRARCRAQHLQELVDTHLAQLYPNGTPRNARGHFVNPALVDPDGRCARERCAGCPRERPLFELVEVPEGMAVPAGWYCGACRGRLERAGLLTRAQLAEACGAPLEVVERYRRGRETIAPPAT